MGTARVAVRVRIHGRVQGVGYRNWVEGTALDAGLDGWVRNRRDGSVEAVIAGAPEAVRLMIERCRAGPSAARVQAIDEAAEPGPVEPGFRQLPTG